MRYIWLNILIGEPCRMIFSTATEWERPTAGLILKPWHQSHEGKLIRRRCDGCLMLCNGCSGFQDDLLHVGCGRIQRGSLRRIRSKLVEKRWVMVGCSWTLASTGIRIKTTQSTMGSFYQIGSCEQELIYSVA